MRLWIPMALALLGGCLQLSTPGQIAGALVLSTERAETIDPLPAVDLRCTDGRQTLFTSVGLELDDAGRRVFEVVLGEGTWSCDFLAEQDDTEWYLGMLRPGGTSCSSLWDDEIAEPFFFVWDGAETAWLGESLADGVNVCADEPALPTVVQTPTYPTGTWCGSATVAQPVAPTDSTVDLVGWSMIPCLRFSEGPASTPTIEGALYHSLAGGVAYMGCLATPVFGPLPLALDQTEAGLGFTSRAPSLGNGSELAFSGVLWGDEAGFTGRIVIEILPTDPAGFSFVLETEGQLSPVPIDDFPARLGGIAAGCPDVGR